MKLLALAVVVLALAVAATPASAYQVRVIAAGGSAATTCEFDWGIALLSFTPFTTVDGRTTCTAAVQQTAQVSGTDNVFNTTEYGYVCSRFSTTCQSSVDMDEYPQVIRYHVKVIAPLGQGWVAVPDECSGAGTDNLTCTFERSSAFSSRPTPV